MAKIAPTNYDESIFEVRAVRLPSTRDYDIYNCGVFVRLKGRYKQIEFDVNKKDMSEYDLIRLTLDNMKICIDALIEDYKEKEVVKA